MTTTSMTKFITEAIKKEIEAEVTAMLAKEQDKVVNRITEAMGQAADRIALKVLRYYSIQESKEQIVITVEKERIK